MDRIGFGRLGLVLLVWGLGCTPLLAQNRTTVELEAEGKTDLTTKVEETVSRFLTEVNRASYFDDRPDLSDQAITEQGTAEVLKAWDQAAFRCPETKITRSLVTEEGTGGFEVPSVPLLVENEDGKAEKRSGILVVNSVGQIDGFLYASERASATETGSITVRTQPEEAVVVSAIGDGTRQRAPARFEDVPPNVYAFTVRKEGYQNVVDTTFVVQPNQGVERTVRLRPKPGRLRIEDVPNGASLSIDGEERPLSGQGLVQLDAGSHRVQLSKKHHTTWDSTLTIPAEDTVQVHPTLQRAEAAFVARSDPAGATVVVNETALGTTPIDTTLEAGRTYTIRLEKEGHVPSAEERVVASEDSTLDRRIVMTPVELRSTADDARLTNLQVHREQDTVRLEYDIVGTSDETYKVGLDVKGPSGASLTLASGAVTGALGSDMSPGSDKQVTLYQGLERAAAIQLTLTDTGMDRRLIYVIGGAVAAVGGGTLAAFLIGGGDGGGSSFPPPPGLPN